MHAGAQAITIRSIRRCPSPFALSAEDAPHAGISRVRFDVENRLNVNLYVDTANIIGAS